MERDSHLLQGISEQVPGLRVELRLHQVGRKVHHVNVQSACQQPTRSFESKQAAAYHDGVFHVLGALDHVLAVV